MKLKSCAITVRYKGCWIHQNTDGSFSWQTPNFESYQVKSWRSAQIAITSYLKTV